MKSYNPQKPLISIHIPKCAGSSFSNVLVSWFGRGMHLHYHNEKRNKHPKKHSFYTGLLRKKLKHGMCIHGHFNNARGNGVDQYYPGADQFISIIRDPFDLHLSTYFYVRRSAQSSGAGAYRAGSQHRIIENGWNVDDYLREVGRSYICNFLPAEITLDNYRDILDDRFLYIGISERLQNSVDDLAQILGFASVTVPQANVSEWNEDIPDGAREEFEVNNPLEIAIYRYVKEKWGNSVLENVATAQQGAALNGDSQTRRSRDRYLRIAGAIGLNYG